MKYAVKADFPYEWYWAGKPLRKGYIRGEHIMPQPVGTTTRRASPDPSPARYSCPRCGREYEPLRTSPPSNNGDTERNPVRLTRFCGCFGLIEDPEPQPVRRCTCNLCKPPAPAPATVQHAAFAPPTPTTRTVTPGPGQTQRDPPANPRMVYCLYCQEYHQVCEHTAVPIPGAQQPVEVPTARVRPAQTRCNCTQCVAAASAAAETEAETQTRRHAHCHLDDCRFENYVSPNVTDDIVSESSVDMGARSDRGEDARCGHLIIAIPMEYTHGE
ncbi:hypothetical protein N7490_003394 [Penicillium lividum]|nr:hypothetical protein N7490_003394 [Penicillium lividum]